MEKKKKPFTEWLLTNCLHTSSTATFCSRSPTFAVLSSAILWGKSIYNIRWDNINQGQRIGVQFKWENNKLNHFVSIIDIFWKSKFWTEPIMKLTQNRLLNMLNRNRAVGRMTLTSKVIQRLQRFIDKETLKGTIPVGGYVICY